MHAYCYASGQIKFGANVPDGAISIAHTLSDRPRSRRELRRWVSGLARHGYKRNLLLVPGIPEAQGDQQKAGDALAGFLGWIKKHVPDGIAITAVR